MANKTKKQKKQKKWGKQIKGKKPLNEREQRVYNNVHEFLAQNPNDLVYICKLVKAVEEHGEGLLCLDVDSDTELPHWENLKFYTTEYLLSDDSLDICVHDWLRNYDLSKGYVVMMGILGEGDSLEGTFLGFIDCQGTKNAKSILELVEKVRTDAPDYYKDWTENCPVETVISRTNGQDYIRVLENKP